jgi:mRNA-degrading endonuclease RelE of RelBE toxin-antitoxin system
MKHFASASFWEAYNKLPQKTQKLADKNFKLLKQDPLHPSIHFKKVKSYWSARVGIKYRALAVEIEEGVLWFWVGKHDDYDKLINK